MSVEQSNLGLITIALTVIGITVLTLSQALGLTIIFAAILLYVGLQVNHRLEQIGTGSFALGSIMVWTGFLVGSFPLIAFAWNIFNSGISRVIMVLLGTLLIIMGYFTTYYDLNTRLLRAWARFRSSLIDLFKSIRLRLFHSVWTFLAIISASLVILTLVYDEFHDFIPNLLGISYGEAIQFGLLMVFFLAIEFRSVIILSLKSLGEVIGVFLQGIGRRIMNLPRLLIDILVAIKEAMVLVLVWFRNRIGYLVSNLYIVSFGSMIGFGSWGLRTGDDISISIAITLFLLGLVNLLTIRPEAIGSRVGALQQSAYQKSFSLVGMVVKHTGACPQCDTVKDTFHNHCSSCGFYLPSCLVCRQPVFKGEQSLTCPSCQVAGHADHMERWLDMKNSCPNCRSPIISGITPRG